MWYNTGVQAVVKINEIKKQTKSIFQEYGVIRSSVVGSFARGEDQKNSDVDILVEFKEPIGLIKFSELQRRLERAINKKVDLMTYRSVYPKLREFLKKDEISLV